jgi:uncharacterized protein (DUF362 family)
MPRPSSTCEQATLSRRELLRASLVGGGMALSGLSLFRWLHGPQLTSQTFIGQATNYEVDLASIIRIGLHELGISEGSIKDKRILLKPNLVEPHKSSSHINTHPLVIRGAIEAFLSLGAHSIIIGEGAGHRHDSLLVLENSGLGDILHEDQIPFKDLNTTEGKSVPNLGRYTKLKTLTFPRLFNEVDWIVSLAKMKTHHWAGATLSMKNLFGVMPGIYYGWPKNILHQEGISQSILDINATLKPHFAIIDGITGMEGDGPIMGTPKQAGVLVMGKNLPAVDATCCRIMGIDPYRITYLEKADQWLGPIQDIAIQQRGESWQAVQTPFQLEPGIPAHQGIQLG